MSQHPYFSTSFLDGIQSVQICFNSNRADQDQIKEVKGKIDTENKLFGVLRQQDDRITRKGMMKQLICKTADV